MFDQSLKKLRDGISFFAGESQTLRNDLGKALDRRADLLSLQLPQNDYIDKICEAIDSGLGNDFSRRLKHKLDLENEPPMRARNHPQFNILGMFDSTQADVACLLYCCRDQIKAGVRETIEGWDWPKEVGPPRAERLKELVALEKTIESLKSKLDKINAIAASEGVALRGGAMGTAEDQGLMKRSGKMLRRLTQ